MSALGALPQAEAFKELKLERFGLEMTNQPQINNVEFFNEEPQTFLS